jgi:ectoine hydroxylase-related dioxygenase (phytanoyl-CoA dioxygenase family)
VIGGLREALDSQGFAIVRDRVPDDLVDRLRSDVDAALAVEAASFPVGHAQHGRILFAPSYGGSFLDLLGHEPLMAPIDELLSPDCVVYTMTSSCLAPGQDGPVASYHRDFQPSRSEVRLGVVAMVLLDPFTARSGATELVAGSHLDRDDRVAPGDGSVLVPVHGGPGDVCYFDARILHRSTRNRSEAPRRAVLVMLVPPWIAPRVDVRWWLGDEQLSALPEPVARRLGSRAFPPRSIDEFVARGEARRRRGSGHERGC